MGDGVDAVFTFETIPVCVSRNSFSLTQVDNRLPLLLNPLKKYSPPPEEINSSRGKQIF